MDTNVKEGNVVLLRLDDIIPNRFQPREIFDESGLSELADSIKEHGVIQPIIVRPIGDKYELIAGERRTKASALAGLTTIPAIVREMSDNESAKISLLENLQRRNLSAIEEARTYKRILELDNMTQEQLAKTMGRSQPMIANKLRLLALPEEVQDALMKNQISERHARSLLNVKGKEEQLKLLDRIRNERLTVRELDTEIKKLKAGEAIVEAEITDKDSLKNDIEKDIEREVDKNMNNDMMNGNFGGNPNNNFGNYRSNFGNMGLNDYQSSINNGMFNNIPNVINQNNQTNSQMGNGFNNTSVSPEPFGQNSSVNQNNNVDYNGFADPPTYKSEQSPNSFSNNPFTETRNLDNNVNNNYNTLGSMFDNNATPNNNVMPESNNNNNFPQDPSNHFISQIKDEVASPKENQFLPNFDNKSNNFNNQYDFSSNSNGFSESMNNNFDNNFTNNNTNFNPSNFESNMNGNFNTNNTNFSNLENNQMNNNFNQPINDFSFPDQNNFESFSHVDSRQGGLFNEPLNLVDVPNNNENMNDNNSDYSFNQSNNMEGYEPNNNSSETSDFDSNNRVNEERNMPNKQDSEENWASFGAEENNETETDQRSTTEDFEASESNAEPKKVNENGEEENNQSNKKEYIQLEPVKTIFDTREAVLELKKTTDRIKENKIKIDTEEIEFDDYYQIVIKIKK